MKGWYGDKQAHSLASRGIRSTYTTFTASGNQDQDVIINKAVEYYGTTDEPIKAGFILPDGRMLDLSGGHQVRMKEHAEVLRDIGIDLNSFIDYGIIRINFPNKYQHSILDIELYKPLTGSQKRTIAGIVKDYDSKIIAESNHGYFTSEEFDSIGRIFMNLDNITSGDDT